MKTYSNTQITSDLAGTIHCASAILTDNHYPHHLRMTMVSQM